MAAILDGVKNVVAARANAAAGGYIKVAGGLLSGGLSGDWRNKMNKPGKASGTREAASEFTTQNLAYPENVEGDPQQGHFIMFMINNLFSNHFLTARISYYSFSFLSIVFHCAIHM